MKFMMKKRGLLLGLILLLAVNATATIVAAADTQKSSNKQQTTTNEKPNIILIYADDLGRGMLSAWGQEHLTTPNIDKLADGGMRFSNAYGSNFCAPARASLLTGMHDCHAQGKYYTLTRAGLYVKEAEDVNLEEISSLIHAVAPVREGEVYLATVARDAGYNTATFGKLEWGFATTPERLKSHGWDYHYGYYDHRRCHGFYPPYLWENGQMVEIEGNTHIDCAKTLSVESEEHYKMRWDFTGKKQYSEHLFVAKMKEYIEKNNPEKTDKPFFIYFPTQLPHGPIQVPGIDPELKDNPHLTSFEKEYATMIKIMDNSVGQLYAKCEELGILDNTIFIFTGDNGHAVYAIEEGRTLSQTTLDGTPYDHVKTKFYSNVGNDVFDGNDGMAGLKRDNWEGGVRVPLIWYWKGKIRPGTESDQLVNNFDILNTVAELIGSEQVKGKDSHSYAKTLMTGKGEEKAYTVFSSKLGPAIVTKDGWKVRYQIDKDVFQLYNLTTDYREEKVLNEQYPEKLESLKATLLTECDGDFVNGGYPQFFEPDPVVRAAQEAKRAGKKKASNQK